MNLRPPGAPAVPALLAAVLSACGPSGEGATSPEAAAVTIQRPFPFTDVARGAGLDMRLTSGATPATQIVEVKGGGLALLDRDRDGDWDLFVPNGATLDSPSRGPGCRLFDNVTAAPGADLAFADATHAANLTYDGWGMGVAVGDVDGDGADDLYITSYGPNALLVNDGEGRFVDRTDAAGVGDGRWGTGCAFGDLDGDGDLDLYVANYLAFDVAAPPPGQSFKGVPVFGGPMGLPAQADVLYANRGDGTFVDVTEASGCADVAPAHGLNVLIADLDRDGRQELWVGNDSMANRLFDDSDTPVDVREHPEFPRRLVDRAGAAGLATNAEGHEQATMGLALADVDGNGLPDLLTTNFSSDTNTLHLNADGRFFDDRTARFGLGAVSRTRVGWAAAFADLDADGDEDLLVFNGHVYSQASAESMDSAARQAPLLFEREGAAFRAVPPVPGSWLDAAHVDRSAVTADLDGDGDVDVIVGERDGPLRLLRNDTRVPDGAWLTVRLEDRREGSANPRGLGAELTLTWPGGRARRWLATGGSYLSAQAPEVHFGLPPAARGAALRLEVRWPDGALQSVDHVAPGHVVLPRG